MRKRVWGNDLQVFFAEKNENWDHPGYMRSFEGIKSAHWVLIKKLETIEIYANSTFHSFPIWCLKTSNSFQQARMIWDISGSLISLGTFSINKSLSSSNSDFSHFGFVMHLLLIERERPESGGLPSPSHFLSYHKRWIQMRDI